MLQGAEQVWKGTSNLIGEHHDQIIWSALNIWFSSNNWIAQIFELNDSMHSIFEHTGCKINAHAVYAPGSQTTSPLSWVPSVPAGELEAIIVATRRHWSAYVNADLAVPELFGEVVDNNKDFKDVRTHAEVPDGSLATIIPHANMIFNVCHSRAHVWDRPQVYGNWRVCVMVEWLRRFYLTGREGNGNLHWLFIDSDFETIMDLDITVEESLELGYYLPCWTWKFHFEGNGWHPVHDDLHLLLFYHSAAYSPFLPWSIRDVIPSVISD
jgi:hypothetical protein